MPGTAAPQHGLQGLAAIFQQLQTRLDAFAAWQRQSRAVAPGTITQWGGPSVPTGALACNGATFTAAQYPRLAAALGSTTLPNLPGSPMFVIWT